MTLIDYKLGILRAVCLIATAKMKPASKPKARVTHLLQGPTCAFVGVMPL